MIRSHLLTFTITLLGAAALAPVAACGGDACHDDGHCAEIDAGPEIDADPSAPDAAPEIVTDKITLVAGEILEGIYAAGAADQLRLEATAGGDLFDWNIHGHVGGDTQVIDEDFEVESVDYDFQPANQADWFLLLRNSGDTTITVDVTLTIQGGTWSGWEGH